MTSPQDSQKKVTIKRVFPAAIDRLWKAFTTVEDMLLWHSPVGMTTPHAEVDFRIGGGYAITMEYDDTLERVTVRGTYKEIQKPTKLVYTWKWDGSDEETEVAIEFHKVSNDETKVVLTHSGFSEKPSEDDVRNHRTHEDHKGGWTTGFDKLERQLVQL